MTFIQPAASHFINGRYVDDTNGPVLELIYPANGQRLGQLHAATPAIVEEALANGRDRGMPIWLKVMNALIFLQIIAGGFTIFVSFL